MSEIKTYRIKVATIKTPIKEKSGEDSINKKTIGNNQDNFFELKIYKRSDGEEKSPIINRKDRSFILNRANSHALMEYLHDNSSGKRNLDFSYVMSYKEVYDQNPQYENCSNYDAYIILRTCSNIDNRIEEVNQKYKEITKQEAGNNVKFIKELKNFENKFDLKGEFYFKKSSPVLIRYTKRWIENYDNLEKELKNDSLTKVFNQVKNTKEFKELYSDVSSSHSRIIYFLPQSLEYYKREGTPTFYIEDDLYIDMLLQSVGLKRKSDKHYSISNSHGISIMKIHKKLKDRLIAFKVIGASFKLTTSDEEFSEIIFKRGLGHLTGYGMGFAFNKNEDNKAVAKKMVDNI